MCLATRASAGSCVTVAEQPLSRRSLSLYTHVTGIKNAPSSLRPKRKNLAAKSESALQHCWLPCGESRRETRSDPSNPRHWGCSPPPDHYWHIRPLHLEPWFTGRCDIITGQSQWAQRGFCIFRVWEGTQRRTCKKDSRKSLILWAQMC